MWSRSIQPNVRLSPEKHDKKNTQNPNPVHRSLNLYGWGPRREAAMLCLMFISVLIVVRKLAHVIIRSDKSTQRSNKIINHEKKYPLQLFWKTLLQTWDVLHLKCIFFSSKHCVIYIHWFFLTFKTRNWIFSPEDPANTVIHCTGRTSVDLCTWSSGPYVLYEFISISALVHTNHCKYKHCTML